MTTTIAARITSVLVGASPTAAVIAKEQNGNQHRLEVTVEHARTLSRGQVLLLQWTAYTVPELETDAVAGEIVDADYTLRRESGAAGGGAPTSPTRTDAMALEAALGAKPGTFSGR